MFDSLDPAQVERYRRELTPACTFEPDPPLSVNVGTRFESDDPEAAVEDAAAAAAETAWTTVESTSSSDQTYFFRRGDFILTISWGRADWVNVSVESPCYASDGTRVN